MFQSAAELIDAEHRMRKSMWGQFWSAHQRFFKYLCISAKVSKCVQLAREAIRDGKVLYFILVTFISFFSCKITVKPVLSGHSK